MNEWFSWSNTIFRKMSKFNISLWNILAFFVCLFQMTLSKWIKKKKKKTSVKKVNLNQSLSKNGKWILIFGQYSLTFLWSLHVAYYTKIRFVQGSHDRRKLFPSLSLDTRKSDRGSMNVYLKVYKVVLLFLLWSYLIAFCFSFSCFYCSLIWCKIFGSS